MNPKGRPISNMIFFGPTGSGKTRTAEALAESIFGKSEALIKIDCAEYKLPHSVAKLTGSPPGYLGHRETQPLLSQETLNQYHTDQIKLTLILFDEIEKAHKEFWNLLLGILDKATLTLGSNEKVDFSRCMIFMTSNVGVEAINSILDPAMGLPTQLRQDNNTASNKKLANRIGKAVLKAAGLKFSPEFLNRIDEKIVFFPLSPEAISEILNIELRQIQHRIDTSKAGHKFDFELTGRAKSFLISEGIKPKEGARHLKRTLERHLVKPFAQIIDKKEPVGRKIIVDCGEALESLTFLDTASNIRLDVKTSQKEEDHREYSFLERTLHGGD